MGGRETKGLRRLTPTPVAKEPPPRPRLEPFPRSEHSGGRSTERERSANPRATERQLASENESQVEPRAAPPRQEAVHPGPKDPIAPPAPSGAAPPLASPRGNKDRREEAAEGLARPAIDPSTPEGALSALGSVPASRLLEAVQATGGAAPAMLQSEKRALAQTFPEIERPTGLPRKGEAKKDALKLDRGEEPELLAGGAREGQPPDVSPPPVHGPLPGSQAETPDHEPSAQAQEGGSWWSWLWEAVRNFFASLPTTDSGVSTWAGPRPKVDLSGEGNPAQNRQNRERADQSVGASKLESERASQADFGEHDIYPDVPKERLRTRYRPTAVEPLKEGVQKPLPELPAEAIARFDGAAAPRVRAKADEQVRRQEQGRVDFEAEATEARAEGQRRLEREKQLARGEQRQMQQEAKAEVAASRIRWAQGNEALDRRYKTEADRQEKETNRQIEEKVSSTEKEADDKLTAAEKEAEVERTKSEAEAARKKREEENRPKSWWERVKGAVKAAFAAIKKLVTAIFDALRALVKKIISAAKAVVRGLIEVARRVVVGAIKTFGAVVKGLASLALIAFPEQAAKVRSYIDEKVDGATTFVNESAEKLKKAADAALDRVGEALDKALSALHKLYLAGLTLMEMLATGEIWELLEKLKWLGEALWESGPHVEGAIEKELIGFDLTQSLGPQLAEGEEGAAPDNEANQADPQNLAFLMQEQIRDDQVVVDPVPEIDAEELPPELAQLEPGQSVVIGESKEPERSTEGVLQSLVGHLAEPTNEAPSPTPQNEAQAEQVKADPEMQAIMERLMKAETRGERLSAVMALIWAALKKFWREKIEPNLPLIILGIVVGLAVFIAAEILTGGAITAALPIIMEVVAAAFMAHDIMRASGAFADYLSLAWENHIKPAAKAFARGIAIVISGLINLILAEAVGAGLKALIKGLAKAGRVAGKAIKVGAKAVVTGGRMAGRAIVKGVLWIGRSAIKLAKVVARMVARTGTFALEKGKLFFKGVEKQALKAVKKLDALFVRLREKFGHFAGFTAEAEGNWIFIFANFNPRRIRIALLVRRARRAFTGIDAAQARAIADTARSKMEYIFKVGKIFETVATKATKAKQVVDDIAAKLASKIKGVYGKPDNIHLDGQGLIGEVEEVKFFGRQTVEDLGSLAKRDPAKFVNEGLGEGKHIQLNRHKATLDAIAADPALLAGTEVKGVASGVRYTVTLPKMSGPEVDAAVKAMQDAFKSRLGIDVTFQFSSASVKDVQSALAALGKAVR